MMAGKMLNGLYCMLMGCEEADKDAFKAMVVVGFVDAFVDSLALFLSFLNK